MPVWTECESCGDYQCYIHGEHVADCSCPPLEDWVEAGFDPYAGPISKSLRDWLEKQDASPSD